MKKNHLMCSFNLRCFDTLKVEVSIFSIENHEDTSWMPDMYLESDGLCLHLWIDPNGCGG